MCGAFPQEWPSLLPRLEYLCETALRSPSGLSAFDVSPGYALLTDLVPFQVPHGMAEADVAAAWFKNFCNQALKAQEEVSKKRSMRISEKWRSSSAVCQPSAAAEAHARRAQSGALSRGGPADSFERRSNGPCCYVTRRRQQRPPWTSSSQEPAAGAAVVATAQGARR